MKTTQAKAAIENILNDEKRRDAVAELEAKWAGYLDQGISAGGGLGGLSVPEREPIMGKWFKKGDLGFIYGARGLGKTWLAMFMARKCAEGGGLGNLPEWNVHGARRVLYVDGEMPLDGTRERDVALAAGGAPGLSYLHHEALFHRTGESLNLADPWAQGALLKRCLRDKIEILFLDNLSCLFSGMRENDADAWEQVLPWLLDLRRNRIAVVFVAHSGRNGLMRGTSRKEDAAFWIIGLSEMRSAESQQGAKFLTQFVKNRNATEADCPPLEWGFIRPPNDPKVIVTWKKLSVPILFRQCVEEGVSSATDIAEIMAISKAQVSRYAAKSMKEGWLTKSGRGYEVKKVSQAERHYEQVVQRAYEIERARAGKGEGN